MSDVLYECRDGIAIITINREAFHNTMNTGVREGLWDAWRRFDSDREAKVAILTGAGTKSFCAGRDLREKEQAELLEVTRDYLPILGVSLNISKPAIAAVNGAAIALGFIFVQMCDISVASAQATFSITEAKMGRGVAWAVPLAKMIPRKVMMELLLTGAPISAQRAYEIGLVNHVVDPGQVIAKAMEVAKAVCAGAPLAIAAARQIVQIADEFPPAEALDRAYAISHGLAQSADAMEGIAAYVERRAPRWTGH